MGEYEVHWLTNFPLIILISSYACTTGKPSFEVVCTSYKKANKQV